MSVLHGFELTEGVYTTPDVPDTISSRPVRINDRDHAEWNVSDRR